MGGSSRAKSLLDAKTVQAMCARSLAFYASEKLTGPPQPPYNGRFLIGQHHEEWSSLINETNRICILAARDHGKTLVGGSLMLRSDGARIPVEDWAGGNVLAYDESTHHLVEAYSPASLESPDKPCLRIRTRTGRTIECTREHPLRKLAEWTDAQNLEIGERIAVPRKLDVEGSTPVEGAWLIGVLVGDGCFRQGTITIAKDEAAVIDAIRSAVSRRGWELHGCAKQWRITKARAEVSCVQWADGLGLRGSGSYEKRVPAVIFSAPNTDIAEFLSGYLDTGAHVNHRAGGSVEYYSVSRDLLADVQHLLLRVGVVAVLSHKLGKYKEEDHHSWRLTIRGKDILALAKHVRPRGKRAAQLRDLARAQEARDVCSGPAVDRFPREVWNLVEHSIHWFQQRKLPRPARKYEPTRAKLERIALAENNERLLALVRSPVMWDEIVEIEDIGNHAVYPITVPGPENYVADDVINHNSHFMALAYPLWIAEKHPGEEGVVFSRTQNQASDKLRHIKDEVETNPKLQHLVPSRKRMWSESRIELANGFVIKAHGYGTKVRGGHPIFVVVDDGINDECTYSETVRNKDIDYFLTAIAGMIGGHLGQIIVVGCVTKGTWVQTPQGLRQIGTLAPGPLTPQTMYETDQDVMGEHGYGSATKYWVNGECETVKLVTDRGYDLEGSLRHPVRALGEDGLPAWRRLDEVGAGDWVAIRPGTGIGEHAQPPDLRAFKARWRARAFTRNDLDLPDRVTPDLAYLLGLWTAEGSFEASGRVMISNTDGQIRDFLAAAPFGLKFEPSTSSPWTLRCASKDFIELVEYLGGHLGKAPTKIIPSAIMQADEATVREFLRGLFDGDGSAYVKGRVQQVTYATTSSELAEQVQILLLHLGIVTTRKRAKKVCKSERVPGAKHPCWSVRATSSDASLYMDRIGFRLDRKQAARADMFDPDPGKRALPCLDVLISRVRKGKVGRHHRSCPVNLTEVERARTVRRETADALCTWYEEQGMLHADAAGWVLKSLRERIDSDWVWVRVESIERSAAETVDFVIPGDHSFISNGFISHNTPLHRSDLYSELRRNPEYEFRRYPAIYDEGPLKGQPLWPERYGMKELEAKRRELNSAARFAREFMVRPVTDDSSLFPKRLFDRENVMQPSIKLGMPLEFWKRAGIVEIFMGVDFGLSASANADFTVIWTMGLDGKGNRWIIDIFRERGLRYNAQKNRIIDRGKRYKPGVIFVEANQAQRIFGEELVIETDLPIQLYHTGAEKNALSDGIPSLRILFENAKYRIPRGDENSISLTDAWLDELQAMTMNNGKIVSVGDHDDLPMANWICERAIKVGSFGFSFGEEDGDEAAFDELLAEMEADRAEEDELDLHGDSVLDEDDLDVAAARADPYGGKTPKELGYPFAAPPGSFFGGGYGF